MRPVVHRFALADLRLSRLYAMHPSPELHPLGKLVEAVPLRDLEKTS